MEAVESDRAQDDGKQGHGAGDGQGDSGGGVPRPARRGGGDDSKESGGEEFMTKKEHEEMAAGDVLLG
jgi:hypothetical protein